jgi:hypothetical protein
MPPYVLGEAEAAHLARGALAALEATLAESDARGGHVDGKPVDVDDGDRSLP